MAEWWNFLTAQQQARCDLLLEQLQREPHWHGDLPVLLLERCWLRLQVVTVQELAQRLPPDASGDAPELVRYRALQNSGLSALEAQEQCWQEFGREACSQALRRFWQRQERGNHGWTLAAYLDLLARYREQMVIPNSRQIPLLVLARQGSEETHILRWCWPAVPPMRHTCP